MSHPKYRADIDGLRALAVLAVVIFHAFPELLKGGFVGVDVFFVISGFLICSIVLGSVKDGTFSFLEFYNRRILRIFPALILVMSVCYAVGWLIMLPAEFQRLGKHMVGGSAFVANLLLWREAGYFDAASMSKPLLHLWSLGVEEQFYILWPSVLLLALRLRFSALNVTLVVIFLSFLLNVWAVGEHQEAAFYLPVTRVWELLLGGALACVQIGQHAENTWARRLMRLRVFGVFIQALLDPKSPPVRDGLSLVGAVLIGSAFLFAGRSHFPGWWALLLTLGACLLIFVGPFALFNRVVLSSRLMVWVGLISYPLYLWHWPLLSFATIMEVHTPHPWLRLLAIFLAVFLAWLTYVCVECPIRFGRRSPLKILVLILLMLGLIVAGTLAMTRGAARSSSMTAGMIAQVAELNFGLQFEHWSACPSGPDIWHCRIMDPTHSPDIALIGDSHSSHLAAGLAEVSAATHHNAINLSSNGCLPVFKLAMLGREFFDCEDSFMDVALNDVINNNAIRTVMLSGYAVNKIRPLNEEHQVVDVDSASVDVNSRALEAALDLTLKRLLQAGKRVVFFVDTPALNFEPEECLNIRPVYFPWRK